MPLHKAVISGRAAARPGVGSIGTTVTTSVAWSQNRLSMETSGMATSPRVYAQIVLFLKRVLVPLKFTCALGQHQ